MTSGSEGQLFSKHRMEALTDGVYAIAITILVLEIKLPNREVIHTEAALRGALAALLPRIAAWVISFLVLAIFWLSNHRLFDNVEKVDGRLLWINLYTLLAASLLPFTEALVGEFPDAFVSQATYAGEIGGLALLSLWQWTYLVHHPELCRRPLPAGMVRAARLRCWGTIGTAALAILIASFDPRFGTTMFLLMFAVTRISRRYERRVPVSAARSP